MHISVKGNDYILTRHLRERMHERFHFNVDWTSVFKINALIKELLESSELDNSCRNNSSFMDHLYNKYGYETVFEFMVNAEHGIVFCVAMVPENNKTLRLVKTCFPTDGKFQVRNKFKKKKEERHEDPMAARMPFQS